MRFELNHQSAHNDILFWKYVSSVAKGLNYVMCIVSGLVCLGVIRTFSRIFRRTSDLPEPEDKLNKQLPPFCCSLPRLFVFCHF